MMRGKRGDESDEARCPIYAEFTKTFFLLHIGMALGLFLPQAVF